jgi:hypothetical protein
LTRWSRAPKRRSLEGMGLVSRFVLELVGTHDVDRESKRRRLYACCGAYQGCWGIN